MFLTKAYRIFANTKLYYHTLSSFRGSIRYFGEDQPKVPNIVDPDPFGMISQIVNVFVILRNISGLSLIRQTLSISLLAMVARIYLQGQGDLANPFCLTLLQAYLLKI